MFTLYCYARVAAKLLSALAIVCVVCGVLFAIHPQHAAEMAANQAIEEYLQTNPEVGRTPRPLLEAYDRAISEHWQATHPGKALPIHMTHLIGTKRG